MTLSFDLLQLFTSELSTYNLYFTPSEYIPVNVEVLCIL